MKILVSFKRVPDPDAKIRVRPDGLALDFDGLKFTANPFDVVALEEALRLKEKLGQGEIVLVSVGAADCVEILRFGLAMGADRALLVRTDRDMDPLAIAKILAATYRRERPAFVLMGKQASDDDSNQVGQMLAALLGIAQATFVSKLELSETQARCSRDTDLGIETVLVKLPAIITTSLRLNTPRYVSLPGIMRAKKKPLEEVSVTDLGVDATARTQILKLEHPPARKASVRVQTVAELVERLKNEAQVI